LAPNAFTEQGVAMLSGILSSDRAINVNIQIMRIFTRIRQMFVDNTELRLEIEKIKTKLDNQDENMEIVFRYLDCKPFLPYENMACFTPPIDNVQLSFVDCAKNWLM